MGSVLGVLCVLYVCFLGVGVNGMGMEMGWVSWVAIGVMGKGNWSYMFLSLVGNKEKNWLKVLGQYIG